MLGLETHLSDLSAALDGKKQTSVSISREGTWKIEGWERRAIRWTIGLKNELWADNAGRLAEAFNQLEEIPVRFRKPGVRVRGGKKVTQVHNFLSWIAAAEKVVRIADERLQNAVQAPTDPTSIMGKLRRLIRWWSGTSHLEDTRNQLQRRILAAKFRLKKVNDGWDKRKKSTDAYNWLLEQTRAYKLSRKYKRKDKEVSKSDEQCLHKLAQYPELVDLMRRDDSLMEKGGFPKSRRESLLEEALKRVVRDHHSIQAFVKFPYHQELMYQHLLSVRVGLAGRNRKYKNLMVERRDVQGKRLLEERVLTLPFVLADGKSHQVSVLDKNERVDLENGVSKTIQEFFQTFKDKKRGAGDLSYWPFDGGVRAENVNEWGEIKSPKDVLEKRRVIEKLTKEEVLQRYVEDQKIGDQYTIKPKQVNGKNFFVNLRASRKTEDLNINDSHGWYQFVVPCSWLKSSLKEDRDAGLYYVYEIGKFANYFPTTTWQTLKMLTNPVPAVLTSRDYNLDLSNREKELLPLVVDENAFLFALKMVQMSIENAKENRSQFHLYKSGCFKEAFILFGNLLKYLGEDDKEAALKDIVSVRAMDCDAPSPLGWFPMIFSFLFPPFLPFSDQLQDLGMFLILKLLGGWRKADDTKVKYNKETQKLENKTRQVTISRTKKGEFRLLHPAALVANVDKCREALYPKAKAAAAG